MDTSNKLIVGGLATGGLLHHTSKMLEKRALERFLMACSTTQNFTDYAANTRNVLDEAPKTVEHIHFPKNPAQLIRSLDLSEPTIAKAEAVYKKMLSSASTYKWLAAIPFALSAILIFIKMMPNPTKPE